MSTLLVHHPIFLQHATPEGHPERADRIRAIDRALEEERFHGLEREAARIVDLAAILRVHPQDYVDQIREAAPEEGIIFLDGDTAMGPKSLDAALYAAGAATLAVDEVMAGKVKNAFCAIRPPGHHAEARRAMGFCLFNNAAVAARHAQAVHGAERVAIVDFDVHHGNGTQDIFWSDPSVLYASTHQSPLFPGTGKASEQGVGNIVNVPMHAGDDGFAFREAMESEVLPRVEAFHPDLLVISAGFDAHIRDPLGEMRLTEADFAWITERLMAIAARRCAGRVVSVLEGGYDLTALARSVATHVATLMTA